MVTKLPLYQQIKTYLRERITAGEYAVNQMIPAEEALAGQFEVSRMTAHKAIRDLVQEGYLVRHPGVGTFVTDRRPESPLVEVRNIADEVTARGHRYGNRVVVREALEANDEIGLKMAMRVGAKVFHTLLVHLEDEVPIQLEERWVSSRWVPDYLQADFSRQTPNQVLVAARPITDLEHLVEAVLPSPSEAELLGIAPATPCLLVNRRTWSDDHLISYARLLHPGDRYKLRSARHQS